MPTKAEAISGSGRMGFVGDILWLGVTAFVLALIMGIVCWPLSAELLPRLLAGQVSNKPTPRIIAETGASAAAAGAPSGALTVNRLPLPGTPPPTADGVGEGPSSTILTTSLAAATELGEIKLSLLDPNNDGLLGKQLPDRKKLAQAQPGPQPSQSASASSASPQPGPRRPRQPHQPVRAAAPGPELVPW
jgi:hypothetical protein